MYTMVRGPPTVLCVVKVLLRSVVGISMLGLSMKVSDILVKIVISYSLRRGILGTTSRASTRA